MEPLFGDMFDLNGDGFATMEEELMGMTMLEQLRRELEKDESLDEYDAWDNPFGDEEDEY